MKRFLLAIVFVMLAALPAQAEEVTFSWTPGTETQATGLNIYMNDWNTKLGNGDDGFPDTGSATVNVDLEGNCKTFWATYFNETIESDKSADARACASGATLMTPGGFIITVTVTPN